jgi:hypothetical protein
MAFRRHTGLVSVLAHLIANSTAEILGSRMSAQGQKLRTTNLGDSP